MKAKNPLWIYYFEQRIIHPVSCSFAKECTGTQNVLGLQGRVAEKQAPLSHDVH